MRPTFMTRFVVTLLGLAAAMVAAAAPQATAVRPLPAAGALPSVSTFFAFPQYSQVQISPGGDYLVIVGRDPKDEAASRIYFVRLPGMKVVGNYSLLGGQQVASLFWVSDRRVVFTTATQDGSLDQPVLTGDIWAVNVDGGNLLSLAYHLGQGIAYQYHYNYVIDGDPSDVGPHQILIVDRIISTGASGIVYRVNVDTGERHQVMTVPLMGAGLTVDDNGQVRLASGINRRTARPVLLYRKPNSVEWSNITALIAGEPLYTSAGPVAMGSDLEHFYYAGYTPGGTLGFYKVHPVTLQKTLLYSDPEYDIDNTFSSTRWLRSPGGKHLVAFEYMAERPTWITVHPERPETKLLASMLASFPGQDVWITSATKDAQQAVVLVSSDRNPGTYYLWDGAKHQLRFLFNARAGIDPAQMAPMQPIEFKTRDGLTIHGYLTLPLGKSRDLPMIVNPHGGPFGIRDDWGFDPEVQLLAAHGYAVLQIEYRGSGGYGAAFQTAGYRQWGGKMEDDLYDGTEWAVQQGIADPKRLCIYGGSYGGYAAIEAVVKYPELFRCAVGYAGVYDLVRLRDRAHTLRGQLLEPFMQNTVGTDTAWLVAHSPADNAGKIKAALFLAHGGADPTVPIAQADEMRAALDKLGKKYLWLYYPKEGHGFFKLDHKVAFYTEMLAFFDQYIGPDAGTH
ncbi:MAG: alpha/beta hydrolase family protein [Gammaproteobacteria bacterium]